MVISLSDSSKSIQKLPDELLSQVIEYLPWKDALRVAGVNRNWLGRSLEHIRTYLKDGGKARFVFDERMNQLSKFFRKTNLATAAQIAKSIHAACYRECRLEDVALDLFEKGEVNQAIELTKEFVSYQFTLKLIERDFLKQAEEIIAREYAPIRKIGFLQNLCKAYLKRGDVIQAFRHAPEIPNDDHYVPGWGTMKIGITRMDVYRKIVQAYLDLNQVKEVNRAVKSLAKSDPQLHRLLLEEFKDLE